MYIIYLIEKNIFKLWYILHFEVLCVYTLESNLWFTIAIERDSRV